MVLELSDTSVGHLGLGKIEESYGTEPRQAFDPGVTRFCVGQIEV
jgi:hypothetical protein